MSTRRKIILCIENDQEVAALIAEGLIERGFAVSVVHSGEEGLAAIRRQPPDLVLCNICMPVMSGFDVFERLKEAPGVDGMPFVFLTALADRENELRAWRLGADDYVKMPVDFDILASIIDTRLARDRAQPKPVDLNEREVTTLTWAARGKTSIQIAKILGLPKRTVDFHIDNARRKLGAHTRIQAVIKAKDGQLIEP